MYLVDTNIWLERLLDQAKSEEVGRFLDCAISERFFITDFAFHSIGVAMSRLRLMDGFLRFIQDIFVDGAVSLIHLDPEDMQRTAEAIEQFGFDFDDAYQYIAAEKYNLIIVSFDSDFDRTDLGRKTPGEVVQEMS